MIPRAALREFQRTHITINEALASFETIEPAIIGLAPSGEIVYVNQSACRLIGKLKEELEDRALRTVAPKMTAEAWSSFWSALDQDDFKNARITLHAPGMRKVSVEFRTLFIHGSGLTYCMMIPPGKRQAAVAKEGTSGGSLVQALNSVADTVVVLDEQHKVTFQNQAACRSLGTTMATAVGTTVYDYLPEKEADIGWQHEQDALDTGRPSRREVDGFMQAKYGASVTMLPYFTPGTPQKRLMVIVNRTTLTADPPPMGIPESLESATSLTKSGYLSDLHEIIDRSTPLGIYLKNIDNRVLWMNHAFARMFGLEIGDFIGKRVDDLISDPEFRATLREEDNYVYATGKPLFNLMIPRFDNRPGYYRLDKIPFVNRNGELAGIIGLVVEVDEPQPPTEALKKELSLLSKKLQETETALRVLVERREQDMALTEEELNAKVRDLIMPYLERLKQTQCKPEQADFINLMEANLRKFYDPAYAKLSSPTFNLSPTELKVAQLIRDGKTNKEIASLLHLSKSTILTHRHHIRVKFGIKNKKVNLRSLLNS